MGLGSMRYVPLLKAKNAEINSLLTAPPALDLTPLFELQNSTPPSLAKDGGPAKRAKSTVTDASYFLDDVARVWAKPSYVDVSRVAPAPARGAWWSLLVALDAIKPAVPPLMPVVSDLDPPAVRAAAAPLAARAQRAALRLKMPHANPSSAGTTVAAVASDLGLAAAQVDVVLDWGDELEDSFVLLDDAQANTAAVVTALGTAHGEIVTLGTPNSADFQQAGDWSRTRREWWLWLRLVHAGLDVTYGDYVLYPPADPVPVSPLYGHLRYSSGDTLHVHRRKRVAGGGGLGVAFGLCCAHLVSQPHFLGPAFSKADGVLADAATGATVVGSAGTWRQLAAEHHFSVVADQLASPPPAPPAGTP